MLMIRCILIDDEQPARELVKKMLSNHDDVEIVAECSNGFDGFKAIKDFEPDLVFLDIQMPKLTGFEMLELFEDEVKPHVVFITAYDQYALKAFEQNAIDYLLKPYTPDRFNAALDKARERIAHHEPQKVDKLLEEINEANESLSRIVVKDRGKIDIIPLDEIHYIKAEDDYVMFYTQRGRFLKKATMGYFETHLPQSDFIRVHRSFIINTQQIKRMERYEKETFIIQLKCGENIKTSKSGAKRLKELLDF
jgi:two-component system, LytTR family, response regulator